MSFTWCLIPRQPGGPTVTLCLNPGSYNHPEEITLQRPQQLYRNWREDFPSWHTVNTLKTGPHFIDNFPITIQNPWKFHFALIWILMNRSLQNFAHATTALTAVLLWHVQKFVVISQPVIWLHQCDYSTECELGWNDHHSGMSPHTKWLAFCRWHFQMQCGKWWLFYFDS